MTFGPLPLPDRFLRSLGGEGGAARAGFRQGTKLIWLPGNLRNHFCHPLCVTEENLTLTVTLEARFLTPNLGFFFP